MAGHDVGWAAVGDPPQNSELAVVEWVGETHDPDPSATSPRDQVIAIDLLFRTTTSCHRSTTSSGARECR